MAFTNPTFTTGEIVTAAKMNQIRDSLDYLKGNAGQVEISAGIVATSSAFPVGAFNRTSTASSGQLSTASFRQTTTAASLSDGFGVQQVFEIEPASGGAQIIGAIGAVRDGADTQGALTFKTNTAQTERMRITTAGSVGIGTTGPGGRLSVAGSVGIGAGYSTTTPPTNGLIVQGNVGIGKNSASVALDVAGDLAVSGALTVGTLSAASYTASGAITSNGGQLVANGAAATIREVDFNTAGVNRWVIRGANATAEGGSNAGSDFQLVRYSDAGAALGTPIFAQRSTGNVGLNTTSPGALLSVNGGISAGSYAATAAPSNGLIVSGNVGIGTSSPQGRLHAVDANGGVLFWSGTGIGGTAVTVATGLTINRRVVGVFAIYHSSGTVAGSGAQNITVGSTALSNDGVNVLTINTSGGTITLQRTSGSGTYDVSFFITYQ